MQRSPRAYAQEVRWKGVSVDEGLRITRRLIDFCEQQFPGPKNPEQARYSIETLVTTALARVAVRQGNYQKE